MILDEEAYMDSSILNLQNLIQVFRISCQTEGKSTYTVEWYTQLLALFYSIWRVMGCWTIYPRLISVPPVTIFFTYSIENNEPLPG
jgi:hypothetical protein